MNIYEIGADGSADLYVAANSAGEALTLAIRHCDDIEFYAAEVEGGVFVKTLNSDDLKNLNWVNASGKKLYSFYKRTQMVREYQKLCRGEPYVFAIPRYDG